MIVMLLKRDKPSKPVEQTSCHRDDNFKTEQATKRQKTLQGRLGVKVAEHSWHIVLINWESCLCELLFWNPYEFKQGHEDQLKVAKLYQANIRWILKLPG